MKRDHQPSQLPTIPYLRNPVQILLPPFKNLRPLALPPASLVDPPLAELELDAINIPETATPILMGAIRAL